MRPRPTMPTVFSASSTPVYFERFHSPFFSAALAGGMLRAVASSRPTASSAALTMLEVGALTTMTPAWVAARDVDVVQTDAGAGDDLELLRGGERLGVDLGRRADQDRVDVGDGGQQLGAVGAVAVPDLEVGAERLDGGRATALRRSGRRACSREIWPTSSRRRLGRSLTAPCESPSRTAARAPGR